MHPQDCSEYVQFLRRSHDEALKEEERRHRFLAEKHCSLIQSIASLMDKVRGSPQTAFVNGLLTTGAKLVGYVLELLPHSQQQDGPLTASSQRSVVIIRLHQPLWMSSPSFVMRVKHRSATQISSSGSPAELMSH